MEAKKKCSTYWEKRNYGSVPGNTKTTIVLHNEMVVWPNYFKDIGNGKRKEKGSFPAPYR